MLGLSSCSNIRCEAKHRSITTTKISLMIYIFQIQRVFSLVSPLRGSVVFFDIPTGSIAALNHPWLSCAAPSRQEDRFAVWAQEANTVNFSMCESGVGVVGRFLSLNSQAISVSSVPLW